MSRKRKDGITEDEKGVTEEFIWAMSGVVEWVDEDANEPKEEPVGVNSMGCNAHTAMLKQLYEKIGHEKLENLKQIIEMALDPDFRCPK